MKRIIKTGSIAVVALSLSGCGNTGAPDCTDGDVKESVIDIVAKEIKNEASVWLVSVAMTQDSNLSKKLVNVDMNNLYAELESLKGNDKSIETVVNFLDNGVLELKMDVVAIRVNSMDDKIKKSECEGNITTSIGSIENVKYLAQYTEDNKVYVKILSIIKNSVADIAKSIAINFKNSYQERKEPQSTPAPQKNTAPTPVEPGCD